MWQAKVDVWVYVFMCTCLCSSRVMVCEWDHGPPLTVAEASSTFPATVLDSKENMNLKATGSEVSSLTAPLFCLEDSFTRNCRRLFPAPQPNVSQFWHQINALLKAFSFSFVSRWRLICVLIGAGNSWAFKGDFQKTIFPPVLFKLKCVSEGRHMTGPQSTGRKHVISAQI